MTLDFSEKDKQYGKSFRKIINEKKDWDYVTETNMEEGSIKKVTKEEMVIATKAMKPGKVAGQLYHRVLVPIFRKK